MGRKNTNGIVNHAPIIEEGGGLRKENGGDIPDPVDATHETGGQLDSVSDMLPTSEPMSTVQQTDMSVIEPINVLDTITPMEEGGETLSVNRMAVLRDLIREYTANKYGEKFDQSTFESSDEGVEGQTETGDKIEVTYEELFSASYSEGGIVTAPEKFRMVMREFKDGTLNSGSGNKVTDKDQAFAIAFAEARKINQGFGRYDVGGDTIPYEEGGITEEVIDNIEVAPTPNKYRKLIAHNEDIKRLVALNGTDRIKYSEAELQMLPSYHYDHHIPKELVNKMWGLARKYGFEFDGKRISAFNIGNGDMLRFIPENMSFVDAVEGDNYLRTICKVLFSNKRVKIHRTCSALSAGKKRYDLAIGLYPTYPIMEGTIIENTLKSGGLMIAILPANLFSSSALVDNNQQRLNSVFELQEAYKLPSDIMNGYTVVVLKRK